MTDANLKLNMRVLEFSAFLVQIYGEGVVSPKEFLPLCDFLLKLKLEPWKAEVIHQAIPRSAYAIPFYIYALHHYYGSEIMMPMGYSIHECIAVMIHKDFYNAVFVNGSVARYNDWMVFFHSVIIVTTKYFHVQGLFPMVVHDDDNEVFHANDVIDENDGHISALAASSSLSSSSSSSSSKQKSFLLQNIHVFPFRSWSYVYNRPLEYGIIMQEPIDENPTKEGEGFRSLLQTYANVALKRLVYQLLASWFSSSSSSSSCFTSLDNFEKQFRPFALLEDNKFAKISFRYNEPIYDSDDEDWDPRQAMIFDDFPFCKEGKNYLAEPVTTYVLEFPIAPDVQKCHLDKTWSVHSAFIKASVLPDISHLMAWELLRDHFESYLYFVNRHFEHRLYKYQFPNSYKRSTIYRSNGGRPIVCFYSMPLIRIWKYLFDVNDFKPNAMEHHVIESNKPLFYNCIRGLLQIFARHFRVSVIDGTFVSKNGMDVKETREIEVFFKSSLERAKNLIFRWVDEIDRVTFGKTFQELSQQRDMMTIIIAEDMDDSTSSPKRKRMRLNEDAIIEKSLQTRLQHRHQIEQEVIRQRQEQMEKERDKQFFRPVFERFLKKKIPRQFEIEEMRGRHGWRSYHFVRRHCNHDVQYLTCALDLQSFLQVLCQTKRSTVKSYFADMDYGTIFILLAFVIGDRFDLNMCFGAF